MSLKKTFIFPILILAVGLVCAVGGFAVLAE